MIYGPAAAYVGTDEFSYTTTDGSGGNRHRPARRGVGLDTDGDGLLDFDEFVLGTDPARGHRHDGISDGVERTRSIPIRATTTPTTTACSTARRTPTPTARSTRPRPTRAATPTAMDSRTAPSSAWQRPKPDTDRPCRAGPRSGDPTDPRKADTDAGGADDGVEEANHNGRVDASETNPNAERRPRRLDRR